MTEIFGIEAGELTGAITCILSRPPSSIGMRLKAEDALAEELGVNHRCLRFAMATLVADGILDRKRGSGTCVRGIPSEPPAAEPRVAAISNRLRPHMLFADLSVNPRDHASGREIYEGLSQPGTTWPPDTWADAYKTARTAQESGQRVIAGEKGKAGKEDVWTDSRELERNCRRVETCNGRRVSHRSRENCEE